ncbi:MAG: hypothetical protein LR011_13945 [Verrucomicrobia bacterium]|nr:hypothetical protein [Verrucomicrobiota bacterium]
MNATHSGVCWMPNGNYISPFSDSYFSPSVRLAGQAPIRPYSEMLEIELLVGRLRLNVYESATGLSLLPWGVHDCPGTYGSGCRTWFYVIFASIAMAALWPAMPLTPPPRRASAPAR